MMNKKLFSMIAIVILFFSISVYATYDLNPPDYGDHTFGYMLVDRDSQGLERNTHGGICLTECANEDIIVFFTNNSGHNADGWSEYVFSRDHGETWENSEPYTFLEASKDAKEKSNHCSILRNWMRSPENTGNAP